MYHTKPFRWKASLIDFVEIIYKVTCLFIYSLHLVDLLDLVGVFVFTHGVQYSRLRFGQMVFLVLVFIRVLALPRVTLVDLWLERHFADESVQPALEVSTVF